MNPTDTSPAVLWRRDWWRVATAAAVTLSALDGGLLQRKSSLFTGGFLSVDHLKGPGEVLVFLLVSVCVDVGAVAVPAALSLAVAGHARLGRPARLTAAYCAALAPFVVADVLAYRILDHLGDAFDFALMFDLVGRSPREIWAVAGSHATSFLVLVGIGTVGLLVLVWGLNRLSPAGAWPAGTARLGCRRALVAPLALTVVGLLAGTSLRLERDSFDNGLRRKPSGRLFGAAVAWVSDFDRDGYGLLDRPRDPAPFDASIHPYAVDLPGNGIDENGVAGDLPADFPQYSERKNQAPVFARRPPVVFVVLETFRADAVGMTLGGKPVTPVLSALANAGVSSAHAYSHNGYTVQSRFHLFSGSLADLRAGTTLIDDFKANGYEVAYFSAQDESFGGSELSVGTERADVFYDARQDRDRRYSTFATAGSLAVSHAVLNERIQEFLTNRGRERPLFLYVNFHDTHFPYHHDRIEPLVSSVVVPRGDIGPSKAQELREMYFNTAANVDRAIGVLLASVKAAVGEEPAVIVTADHGESLYEEGFLGHGYALNDVQTRIPLIVSGLPVEIPEPFGQADLRDVVRQAMALTDASRPRTVPAGGPVFQYLGQLARPAQVAWNDGRRISTFDLREGVGLIREGGEVRRSGADGQASLIHLWESMVLAQWRSRP